LPHASSKRRHILQPEDPARHLLARTSPATPTLAGEPRAFVRSIDIDTRDVRRSKMMNDTYASVGVIDAAIRCISGFDDSVPADTARHSVTPENVRPVCFADM
jgi:hypothetical protein